MSVSDGANLIMALATVISVIYIARQLSFTRKQAIGQFLFELDNQFLQYRKLHQVLMGPNGHTYVLSHENLEEVWRYLGLFERCKILLDNGTISLEMFDTLYGYRLYRAVANESVRKTVTANHDDYRLFIRLCQSIVDFKRKRGMKSYDREFELLVGTFPREP